MVGNFFNVRVPSEGGSYTINRGRPWLTSDEPFANRDATTLRVIFDLADPDGSLYIQSTGQSGNPFSPYYNSMAPLWQRGEYLLIPTHREAILHERIGTWNLVPASR
jgi:penicillin amidase